MSKYHIAQLNIATLLAPIDSPQLSDFVANLDRINALADDSPGFVWRLQTEDGDATGIDYFGSDKIVNLSVWESVETLHRKSGSRKWARHTWCSGGCLSATSRQSRRRRKS